MKLTHYAIHPELKSYVEKIWVFESAGPIPESDLRIIVPNGLIKMVIPLQNGLKAMLNGNETISSANTITLIGISDLPSVVVDEKEGPSASIGIEFSPWGAYRFFNLSLEEVRNKVLPLTDLLAKTGIALQEQLADARMIQTKVYMVQQFLRNQLARAKSDEIFEFCIQKITRTQGRIQVSELEKITGYSSRWLNMKFNSRLGISPKNLCSIVRFQQIYQELARSGFIGMDGADIYNFYHDQAHFIKDFKRFTGYSPGKYQIQENDFGRIFYKG